MKQVGLGFEGEMKEAEKVRLYDQKIYFFEIL